MASPYDRSDDDRTETASAYRREEFRKQGTVALSKELLTVAVFFGFGLMFYFSGKHITGGMSRAIEYYFNFQKIDFGKTEMIEIGQHIMLDWIKMIWPVFLMAIVVGVLACVAQVGFHVTWEPLNLNFDKLNPVAGLQRLFSGNGIIEAIKALLKSAVALGILYLFLKWQIPNLSSLFQRTISDQAQFIFSGCLNIFFILTLVLAVVAAADYGYQRFQLEKQMKMTKREVKEEFKMREGDPLIKARIKNIQRRMSSRRMMDNVKKADVIVTNPTHFAIALKYDPKTMHAPQVLAKGAGPIALKIKEMARFHHIPCVENKPLARTLFKEIEVNQYIPRELYKAVAEVLAYVYRLKAAQQLAYSY